MALAMTPLLSTALFAAHPNLQQAFGPNGEHFPWSDDTRFPHVDSVGQCWQPADYDRYEDTFDSTKWVNYEDSVSELMRKECPVQPWMAVCGIPLNWASVECDIFVPEPPAPVVESNGLPLYIVLPFQFVASIWKLGAIGIVMLPWWVLLTAIAFIDWVVDWAFLLTIGLLCKPCAGFFIWIVNIAHIPFTIWGWLMTILLEVFAFRIDGWMILFKGSGCFLRYGRHCWAAKLTGADGT